MLFKHILSALLIALATTPLQAQQASNAKPAAATKSDSVVTIRGRQAQKPANPVLAANATDDKKGGYKTVPLAGEKAYFGEKNDFVNEYVRKYLELHNKTLGNVQNYSTTPFSVIDNVLQQKNLPKELKYLAVIESALNHNAVSRAGAVGPWQLMASTARMLGLSVSRGGDERRDLYKSTTAATKYLELLYSQLNDWLLVIAAYNSGPIPVQRAIERTGSHNFWDIKQYLPRETQGHVLAFIATASIFENLSKFISLGSVPVDFQFGKEEEPLKPIPAPIVPPVTAPAATTVAPGKTVSATAAVTPPPAAKPITTTPAPPAVTTPAATVSVVKKANGFTDEELKNMAIIRITEPLHFDIVNAETGIDKKLLARWNPDYDLFVFNKYPTPYYNLRLPKDKLDVFLQKKEVMKTKSKAYIGQFK